MRLVQYTLQSTNTRNRTRRRFPVEAFDKVKRVLHLAYKFANRDDLGCPRQMKPTRFASRCANVAKPAQIVNDFYEMVPRNAKRFGNRRDCRTFVMYT
jgi:hypothetical protein